MDKNRILKVRVDDALMLALDAWRRAQIDLPSRGEAVRRMVLAAQQPPVTAEAHEHDHQTNHHHDQFDDRIDEVRYARLILDGYDKVKKPAREPRDNKVDDGALLHISPPKQRK